MIQRLALVGILGFLQAGCVAAVLGNAPNSGTVSDTRLRGAGGNEALQNAVHARLAADGALRGADVQVSASGSVVTLTGTARTAAQSSAAGRVARATSGVSSVVNQLKVL
jgi:osmotically-inducible protein OsmY